MFLELLLLTTSLKASSERCPCIKDYPSGVNVSDDCFWITANNQQYCYNNTFGLEACKQWDADMVPYCQNNEQSFCNLPWCYVDRSNCSLAKKKSLNFPDIDLHYSYATCDVLDSYHMYHMASSIKGKTLKVVALNNTGGWRGAYFVEGKDYFTLGGHKGPTWEFFLELANGMGFEIELVWPSNVSIAAKNITSGSIWTATVHDIALGYVDIGVGLFAQTHKRYQLSLFTPTVYPQLMYLATFFDRVDDGSVFMMFAPFSRDLWILLVIAIVTVFLLIMFFEGYESHNKGGNFGRTSVFLNIVK